MHVRGASCCCTRRAIRTRNILPSKGTRAFRRNCSKVAESNDVTGSVTAWKHERCGSEDAVGIQYPTTLTHRDTPATNTERTPLSSGKRRDLLRVRQGVGAKSLPCKSTWVLEHRKIHTSCSNASVDRTEGWRAVLRKTQQRLRCVKRDTGLGSSLLRITYLRQHIPRTTAVGVPDFTYVWSQREAPDTTRQCQGGR